MFPKVVARKGLKNAKFPKVVAFAQPKLVAQPKVVAFSAQLLLETHYTSVLINKSLEGVGDVKNPRFDTSSVTWSKWPGSKLRA